jgi:hypothetical protein
MCVATLRAIAFFVATSGLQEGFLVTLRAIAFFLATLPAIAGFLCAAISAYKGE